MGKKRTGLWRGLTTTTAAMLAISVGGTAIANVNAAFINSRLGTSNYKTVDKADGETVDTNYFKSEFSSTTELVEAKTALAEQISEEGSVLLKNHNGALPVDSSAEKVTLWGMNSHTPTLGGMIGSSTTVDEEGGQVAYDLERALTEKGFELNQTMIDLYSSEAALAYARQGFGQTGHGLSPSFGSTYEEPSVYPVGEIPASLYDDDILASADDTTAIVVLSRDSSEAADYGTEMENGTEGDSFERVFALSDYEREMIALAKEHSTKVIVLINAINTMELQELKDDEEIDAILWVGEPGVNGFLGVADVLNGTENPSGHLPDTYASNSASSPAMVNFGLYQYSNSTQSADPVLTETNKADWYVVESEGIYSGYKYYETRYEDEILNRGNATAAEGATDGESWNYEEEMTYPFGYGLSYTTFEQTLDSVDVVIGGESKALVTVKNTGDTAGKSVVQLYVQAPYTEGELEKASIQLVGFAKTGILDPGQTETVSVDFDAQYFASYDEDAVKENGTAGAWVLDSGDYYFAIGNGAHEALNNVIAEKTGDTEAIVAITEDEIISENCVSVWNLENTDMETYSENVENKLEDADINKLIADTVEYTTREDWTKGWTEVESIEPTDEMMKGLTNSRYSLSENGEGTSWDVDSGLKLIDFIILDEDGNYESVIDIDDPMWDQLINQISLDEAINFIEKHGDDTEAINSIMLPLTYEQDGPLGITYDQVGGYYVRWNADNKDEATYVSESDDQATTSMNTMPLESIVAATFNKELAKREGELIGEDGLWANVNAMNAPGLNIHRNPYNARNHEYYSEDPMLTSYIGTAFCEGGKEKGSMMLVKHLAFNHQELNRSGISTFVNEQGARENELRAFQLAMSSNQAMGAMTAFNRLGTDYSGAHKGLLEGIVREEWGHTGALVTDMINGADYMNWRDVVFAGGGNCLTTSAYDTSEIGTMADAKEQISKDTEFQLQMKQGIKYWLYNLASSSAINGLSSTTTVQYTMVWWQYALIAVCVFFGALTVIFAAFGVANRRKAGKES